MMPWHLLLFGIIVFGCAGRKPATPPPPPSPMPSHACLGVLDDILQGTLSQSQGLPPGCLLTPSDAERLQATPAVAAPLGPSKITHTLIALPHPAGQLVRAWLREDTIALLEVQHPAIAGSPGALLASLGEPAAKLDYSQGSITHTGCALIFPARGLAVFSNPARDAIVRIHAFPPCTLAHYTAHLHYPEGGRRLPKRR